MTPQLQYVRLPLDGFRLMKLSMASDGSLFCSLTTHSFEKPPSYVALSYVWGDRHGMRDLECTLDSNGHSGYVSISTSLYASLVALHQQPVPLWVDALCINQKRDRVEKKDQVTKMYIVYQNATQVIAWLGGEQGHSMLAMDVLAWLADPTLVQKPISMWPPLLQTSTWLAFFTLDMALSHTQLLYNPNVQTPPQYQPEGMHSFTRLRSHMYSQAEGTWFCLYVTEGRYKSVGKDVDRIYALRALANEQIRADIPVEYELEDRFWLVYLRAAKVMMQHFTMQVILAQIESTERAPELPSWCPDFRHPPLSVSYGASGRAGFGVPKIFRHDPSNENVIVVGGIVTASIVQVVRGYQ